MKNPTEVPSIAVTIKKQSPSQLKKKNHRKSNSESNFNIDLAPFSSEHQNGRALPSLTLSHYTAAFSAADPIATPSLGIHMTPRQAPSGAGKEPICEGANTRSPIIAQRRQNIATKSMNYVFCLKKRKRIALGFKDTLLKDDSTVVNIHDLYIRTFAPPHSPAPLVIVHVTASWISRVNYLLPDGRAIGSYSVGPKEALVSQLLLGKSKSTSFAADPQRTLCEDQIKKYPFTVTEATERRSSVHKIEATMIQRQSK